LLSSALFSHFLSGLLFFEVGIAPVGIVDQPDKMLVKLTTEQHYLPLNL
jgi:hypothetical protein